VRDVPTTLWTVTQDGKAVSCHARLVTYGIEIDIVHDGTVVLTRVFATDVEALSWADEKRAARVAQGWNLVPVDGQHVRPF
jgi:hypothetical protein